MSVDIFTLGVGTLVGVVSKGTPPGRGFLPRTRRFSVAGSEAWPFQEALSCKT